MFNDYYRGKHIFITGHTGFKGSWLSQWLVELGATVSGYSIGIPSEPSNFEILGLENQMDSHIGDVRDLELLQEIMKDTEPELVFHLAAQSLVRNSYDEPKKTFETNLIGTVNVLEAVRNISSVKNVIVITSDKCYENVEWVWGYRENDRLGGKDPYSASKACAEIAVRAYMHSFFASHDSVKIATTRAGNVIGGGDWAADRIVPDCIRAWSSGLKPCVRNPSSTRPWQHVLEPLSGYLTLGSSMGRGIPGLKGESFNFGPTADVNQPVSELINQMTKTWEGFEWEDTSDLSDSRKESTLLKLNCDKALLQLNWQPTMTFTEAVNMTAGWYKSYYSNICDMRKFTLEQIHFYEELARERQRTWALDSKI